MLEKQIWDQMVTSSVTWTGRKKNMGWESEFLLIYNYDWSALELDTFPPLPITPGCVRVCMRERERDSEAENNFHPGINSFTYNFSNWMFVLMQVHIVYPENTGMNFYVRNALYCMVTYLHSNQYKVTNTELYDGTFVSWCKWSLPQQLDTYERLWTDMFWTDTRYKL